MSKSPACMASLASMAALSALHLGRLCVAVLPPEPTWSRLIRRPPGDAGGEGSSWGRPRLSPGRMSGEGGAEQRGTSSTPAGATLEGGPMPVQPMRDRAAARSRCSFVAAHLRMASGELALSRSGGPRASVAPFDPPSAPMAAAASGPILCTSSSTVSASARASCSRWRARLRSSDTIASSGTSSRSCETRGGGWTVARAAPRSASARWNSVAAVPQAVLGSTPCIASISAMSPRGMSGALTPPRPSLSPPDEAGRVNGAAPQPPRAMSPTSPVSTSSRWVVGNGEQLGALQQQPARVRRARGRARGALRHAPAHERDGVAKGVVRRVRRGGVGVAQCAEVEDAEEVGVGLLEHPVRATGARAVGMQEGE
eukprot:scaffold57995_cov28-Tisochrysis_lutea.AAC.3